MKLQHLQELLLRYHRYLGLDHKQYVVLETCLQFDDLDVICEITGFSEEQILDMLAELLERNVIQLNDAYQIDVEKLYELLKYVEQTTVPFRKLLIYEYAQHHRFSGSEKHIGQVELVPMKRGIAVRLHNGLFLSLRQTKELSQELLAFASSMSEDELYQVNMQARVDSSF